MQLIGLVFAGLSFSMFVWLCYKAAKGTPSIKDIYKQLKDSNGRQR